MQSKLCKIPFRSITNNYIFIKAERSIAHFIYGLSNIHVALLQTSDISNIIQYLIWIYPKKQNYTITVLYESSLSCTTLLIYSGFVRGYILK